MEADPSHSTAAAVLALLLVIWGLLAGAQIAMPALGRAQVRQFAAGGLARRALAGLIARPAHLLATLAVAGSASAFAIATVAAWWVLPHLALVVALPLLAGSGGLVLAAARLAVVSCAQAIPERFCRVAALPVQALVWLLLLPTLALVGLANLLTRARADLPATAAGPGAEAQIQALLDLDPPGNRLEAEERAMIGAIVGLAETLAREVMVPRGAIVAVEAATPLAEAARTCISHRLSRLPVYRGDLDHVVGVVHAKDLLSHLETGADGVVGEAARPAYFVPATKRADALLGELRQRRLHMAIVQDERGATAGLVTVEDLLEEVVGEIYDEHDLARPRARRLDADTWLLDGTLGLEEAERLLGRALPRGEYDTLAGLLYDRLGAQVAEGDQVAVPGLVLAVAQVAGRRIAQVRAAAAGKAAGGRPHER